VIHSRQPSFAPAEFAVQPLAEVASVVRASVQVSATRRKEGLAALAILDAPRRHYSMEEAYAYCRRLLRARQESGLVMLQLLPEPQHPGVLAVHAFARAAADFAEAPAYEGKRHFALDQWEHELFRTFHGEADHPTFVALRDTVERFALPITPFTELLSGFRLDLRPAPYATFEELRTYCRHRSETLGQIVLRLFGYSEPSLLNYAADLCTALQLVAFLQDLGHDLGRGRVYIPVEDLHHFGISDGELALAVRQGGQRSAASSRAFRDLLRFQSARARALFERGRPLLDAVGDDLSLELGLTYHAAQALLDKIDAHGEAVLDRAHRLVLGRGDRARVVAQTLGPRWRSLSQFSRCARWIYQREEEISA